MFDSTADFPTLKEFFCFDLLFLTKGSLQNGYILCKNAVKNTKCSCKMLINKKISLPFPTVRSFHHLVSDCFFHPRIC